MSKKILIFDFDGTIADSRNIILETINKLSEKYGYKSIQNGNIEELRNKTIKELFQILRIPWIKLPLLLIEYRKKYSQQISLLKPIIGIKEVLTRLQNKGCELALVTSNSKENVRDFLQKNNIRVFNNIRAGLGLFGKSSVLNKLIREKNYNKEEVFYIGDEVRDIEASNRIGIEVIAVTWGFQSKSILKKYKPNYLVDTPNELYQVVKVNSKK